MAEKSSLHLDDVADVSGVEGGAAIVQDAVAEGEGFAGSGVEGAQGLCHLKGFIAVLAVDGVGNGGQAHHLLFQHGWYVKEIGL